MNKEQQASSSKTVLITGASSGIGLEFARVFGQHGFNLVLISRNQPALDELAEELAERNHVSAKVVVKDLAVQGAPVEIYEQLHKESLAIDILVNCAGFGTSGPFSNADLTTQLSMIQVNIAALTHLTHLFLRDMLQRGQGKILNVASTAAFQPGPLMAVYYATKAYVLSFSEAIAEEVSQSGVTVTVLCPGPTKTAFQERANIGRSRLVKSGILDVFEAKTVAEIGYGELMRNRVLVIPGLKNRILVSAVRLFPRRWVTRAAKRLNERM